MIAGARSKLSSIKIKTNYFLFYFFLSIYFGYSAVAVFTAKNTIVHMELFNNIYNIYENLYA